MRLTILFTSLALLALACGPAGQQGGPQSTLGSGAPASTDQVRFPGRVAGFQLTRAAEAQQAPDPPPAILAQWAGVLREYDLARLDGELAYLGTAQREDGAQLWAFRVQTHQRAGGRATGDYELVFATSADGEILDAR